MAPPLFIRLVPAEEGEKKAKEFNVMFIETSAKAGHNVKTLFRKIAQELPGMENTMQEASKDQSNDRLPFVFPCSSSACWLTSNPCHPSDKGRPQQFSK